ncbi:hypothetical protein Tco_0162319 [Tanacetum coccineum]
MRLTDPPSPGSVQCYFGGPYVKAEHQRPFGLLQQPEVGSYGLKELDAYSIRTTLLDDALPRKDKTYRALLYLVISIITVKNPKGIAENVLVGIEAKLIGEALILNRSLHPLYEYYIELNNLNEPLELRRNQVDDLEPTIEEVVENMDSYRDEGMGDIIVGRPFCKEACIKANRFDEMITIGVTLADFPVS